LIQKEHVSANRLEYVAQNTRLSLGRVERTPVTYQNASSDGASTTLIDSDNVYMPLDTKWVISEMHFPANLLASTDKTKPKPGETTQKYTAKQT